MVDHFKGTWLIHSTLGGTPNFQLWKAKVNGNDSEWIRLMDPNTGQLLLHGIPIEGSVAFQHYIVIQGCKYGLIQLWVVAVDEDSNVIRSEQLNWDVEPAHSVDLDFTANFDATSIIVEYESLVSILLPLVVLLVLYSKVFTS